MPNIIDGWGLFGVDSGNVIRVWLRREPIPDDKPTGFPTADDEDNVIGESDVRSLQGACDHAAQKIAARKIMRERSGALEELGTGPTVAGDIIEEIITPMVSTPDTDPDPTPDISPGGGDFGGGGSTGDWSSDDSSSSSSDSE